MTRLLAILIVGLLSAGVAGAHQSAYVSGAQDVLNVSVYDQPELTGKFSVEAELIKVADGKVELKKADGTLIAVPLDRLSTADQAAATGK